MLLSQIKGEYQFNIMSIYVREANIHITGQIDYFYRGYDILPVITLEDELHVPIYSIGGSVSIVGDGHCIFAFVFDVSSCDRYYPKYMHINARLFKYIYTIFNQLSSYHQLKVSTPEHLAAINAIKKKYQNIRATVPLFAFSVDKNDVDEGFHQFDSFTSDGDEVEEHFDFYFFISL